MVGGVLWNPLSFLLKDSIQSNSQTSKESSFGRYQLVKNNKDFILGFMFYKYLSEKELAFFYSQDMTEADIQGMDETDTEFVEYTKDKIGYFIAYDNLFSTWISK